MNYLIVVYGLLLLIGIVGVIRNYKVYRENRKIINAISKKSYEDINAGKYDTWRTRWEEYDKLSYNKMFYTFWKPVNSFYDIETFKCL